MSSWIRVIIGAAAVAAVALLVANPAQAADAMARITVEAGQEERMDVPVSVELPGMAVADGQVRLVEVKGDKQVEVPAQVQPTNPPRLHWILGGLTPAGQKRLYELSAGQPASGNQIQVKPDETGVDIVRGQAKVLHFQSAVMPPPAGADPRYARGGFIHPLYSPAGEELTRIHAPDHIHHLGLWNPWTSTEFEGRHIDFWNIKDGTGTVRFVKFLDQTSGPVYASFRAALDHVALGGPGGEKVALNEVLDVRVWNIGSAAKAAWMIDITTTQKCASASPLKLLKYRYGGLGFRGTAQWNDKNSDYLTSEGKNRQNGHGTRARWCAVFGDTTKGPAGIEFMSHPGNREHPEPVRIWPESNVFFNFCPIQSAQWIFEPGKEYTLRYRLYVYDGKLSAPDYEALWQAWGNPPVVKLESK